MKWGPDNGICEPFDLPFPRYRFPDSGSPLTPPNREHQAPRLRTDPRRLKSLITLRVRLRTVLAGFLVSVLFSLALPFTAQAGWTYTTNNGEIAITGYTDPVGDGIIPNKINGLPVTSIADWAFCGASLTSVTMPDSLIRIGVGAFTGCLSLAAITVDPLNSAYSSVDGVLFNKNQTALVGYPGGKAGAYTIPDSVTTIGEGAFSGCSGLTIVVMGNSVTSIEDDAFESCTSLIGVTIGNSVTNIGAHAFASCASLTEVCFRGNAPSVSWDAFYADGNTTFYYLPGTTGWDATFDDHPTALWHLPHPTILSFGESFGIRTNQFGFITSWARNFSVRVEACTNLAHPLWSPLATLALTNGWAYFSDPDQASYKNRFYRLCAPPAPAQDFTYTTNNGTITITGYTGPGGDVTIPNTINGLPVTSIVNWGFWGTNLTSVTIPDSVSNIGDYVFNNCSSLTTITLGNSVTNIGAMAFKQCASLTAITVPALDSAYSSVDGVLFNKSQTTLVAYPGGKAGACVISDTVTNIGDSAFYDSTGLTSVAVPDGVTSIGDEAFEYCTGLTNVTIGSGVTNIGSSAFSSCYRLTAISVDPSNSIYSSLGGVLFNKSQTVLIQYPTGKAGAYTIPNTVTNIGDSAFYECPSLIGVTIPDSVISIGDEAFASCLFLTSITIPKNVTSVGAGAFASCYGLTAITADLLNSAYSTVDGVLFNKNQTVLVGCPGGKVGAYTIPNSVASIGKAAFEGCYSVTNVAIGNSVTSIADRAFFASSLTSVTLPDSLISIGDDAFGLCPSLTSVTISGNVTNIGNFAFLGCPGLTNVTVGHGVLTIGDCAFCLCDSLMAVQFQGNAPDLSTYAFDSQTGVTVYYLPGTAGWDATFDDCPTAPWYLPHPVILDFGQSFGIRTNQFGFILSWATNASVVVDACTNLAYPVWSSARTNTLSGGWSYFSDPDWTNYPSRLYRLHSL